MSDVEQLLAGIVGRKNDQEKNRLELFPYDALIAISHVLTFGAKKYGDRNWEKGMRWSRVYAATLRHLFAWFMCDIPTKVNYAFGEFDEETKFSHLWHAGCCIVFLICYESRQVGIDDRPVSGSVPRESSHT